MYCTNCGRQIEDDAVFCPFCGQKVTREDIQPQEPNVNVSYNNYNEPQDSNVNESHYTYNEPQDSNVNESHYTYNEPQGSNVNESHYTYNEPQDPNMNQTFNTYNGAQNNTGTYTNTYTQSTRSTQEGEYQNAYRSNRVAPRAQVDPWQALTYIGCFLLFISLFLPFKSISYSGLSIYRSYDFNIFSFSATSYIFLVTLPLLCYFTATKRPYLDLLIVCGVNVILFMIPALRGHSAVSSIFINYDFGFFLGILALAMSVTGPVIYMLQCQKSQRR